MTKSRTVLFVMVATLLVHAAPTLDTIVANFYPDRLSAQAQQRHYPDERQQTYATFTLGGTSYVLAAYSNGHLGALRLLRNTTTGYVVSDDATAPLIGQKPEITACDLDRDGTTDEALVTFETGRGAAQTWVYQLANGKLIALTPTTSAGQTELGFPEVLDTGSGPLDLVDDSVARTAGDDAVTHNHFILRSGKYASAAPLDFFGTFYRDTSSPVTATATFDVPGTALGRPYRLTIVNGGSSRPDYRVSSGEIKLNGITVSAPSDFSQTRSAWTLPVTLQEHNVLAVRLQGQPKSRVAVLIQHD